MTQTVVPIPESEGGGSFDPTDIEITDDTSGALLIKEGSNEYMRINTTNGSELNQLKMPLSTGEFKLIQETSAGPYEFIKTDSTSITLFPKTSGGGFSFNGMVINTAGAEIQTSSGQINMGASLPVSGSGVRAYISTANHSWTELLAGSTTSKIQRVSDGLKMLEVNTDTDATFTLDDSAGGIFKVQDDAGTPQEFLKIDSTTGARRAELKTGHSNQYVVLNQTGDYAQLRNGSFNQVYLTGNDTMELYGKFLSHRQFSGGFFRTMNAGNTIQLFAVEENSNATFRLNTATPGVFKVQDHGTTNDFLKIDSTPTAALVEFNIPANQGAGMTVNLPADSGSNTGFQILPPSGYFRFGRQTTHYSGGTQLDSSIGVARFTMAGNSYQLQSTSPDIVVNLNASAVDFKVTDSGDADILKIEENSSTTFTLEEANDARFRIMGSGSVSGGSASPQTYLDIQSKNNNSASGEYIKLSLEPEAGGRFFELGTSSAKLYCQNAKLDLTTAAATFTLYDDFMVRQYQSGKRILVCEDAQNQHEALTVDKTADSTFNIFAPSSGVTYAPVAGSSFKVRRRESGGTVDCLTVAPDSGLTHTLDDASSAVFKVVDNNSSPKTYLSITQNGGCVFGETTGQTLIEGSNVGSGAAGVHLKGGTIALKNYNSQTILAMVNGDEVLWNSSAFTKNQAYYGQPVDTTSSGTTSITGQEIRINQTFRYDPTNSLTADGVITVKFEVDKAFYSDGTTPAERMVTFHNKNTTHDATYILLPNTSHGTLNVALGTTDAKATAIANSGGLTLKPGEYIILRLMTLNLTGSTSDARHTISTIAHNIP